jgi:hypothetical protein
MPQPPAHCHLTRTYCLWAFPLMIHKRQNLMAFSWSWTLQARCEWALLWVYPDVRSLSWYAAFEVLERKIYLCVITWFKVKNRSPLMPLWFCWDGFTTWHAILTPCCNVILTSHSVECTVLHKYLPLCWLSQMDSCTICTATAVPHSIALF